MTSEGKNKSKDSEKLLLVLILVVLAWNSWKIFEIGNTATRVDKYNQGVVDEMGKMIGNVKLFSEDLNEIKRFLLLPEKNYFGEETQEVVLTAQEKTSSETSLAAFALLDSIVKNEKAEKNRIEARPVFEALFTNADFQSKIAASQLRMSEKGDLLVKFVDAQKILSQTQQNAMFNQPLYQLIFAAEENMFKVQSAVGEQEFKDYLAADFPVRLADYLHQNISNVRNKKADDKKLAEDTANKAKTDAEAELNLHKKELEDIVHEKAFSETLASVGLKVAEKPREEYNKYIFDIVDGAGKVKLSLALEISSGMIKVIRGQQELDIKSFLESNGAKKNP